MENEDPVKGLIGEMNKRLRFDPSRFSLDEFDHLEIVDEMAKMRILGTSTEDDKSKKEEGKDKEKDKDKDGNKDKDKDKNKDKNKYKNKDKDKNKDNKETNNTNGSQDDINYEQNENEIKEETKNAKNIKDLQIEVKEEIKLPKKGILKPSVPPGSFTKRSSLMIRQHSNRLLSRFLPIRSSYYGDYESKNNELNPNKLKRVRFSVPLRSTSYIVPYSVKLVPSKDNKYEQFMGIEGPLNNKNNHYSAKDILEWYLSICNSREELPNGRFLQILEEAIGTNQSIESIILTGQSFPVRSLLPVSDVLDLFQKLTRLELDDCNLNDESIKVLVSNLLTNDRISMLSLANNPNIQPDGFKYIATYISLSKNLKSLDLSGNPIHFYSAKHLARGIMQCTTNNNLNEENGNNSLTSPTTPSSPGFNEIQDTSKCSLEDLKLNECFLKPQELKVLAQGIIKSNIRSLSLCGNNISPLGAQHIATILCGSEKLSDLFKSSKLAILDLSQNNIKTEGLNYILSPISSPNSMLEELKIGNNMIDEFGLVGFFEALKTNNKLHYLDLSSNSVCGPLIDGLWSIKSCLAHNTTLISLFLSDTNMNSEGAIALAEVLPETKSLTRLDISLNSKISLAGMLALSVSAKLNYSITCLEVTIPPNNPEMSILSQDMLTTCARNTQLIDDLTFRK